MIDCMQISMLEGEIALQENFEGTQPVRLIRKYCVCIVFSSTIVTQALAPVTVIGVVDIKVPKHSSILLCPCCQLLYCHQLSHKSV